MTGKLAPVGSAQREYQIGRLLDDTGFFCRFVLGMDTDRDQHGNALGEIGKGGVRDNGPHQKLVEFIDDESPEMENKLVWCPRYAYKSSVVTGLVCRLILRHPDIAMLLCMHSVADARDRCRMIRDILVTNPIIVELFGDLRGPKWSNTGFITSHRRDHTLASPTLWTGSPQKALAGGRPNYLIFDDVTAETDVGSELKLRRARQFCENALALRARGARTIMVATPWDEGDASHWALDAGWARLIDMDIGCDVVRRDDGTLDLEGESRWPNLSLQHLRGMLRGGMQYEKFMSQFKLQIVRGTDQKFRREHFHPVSWSEKHRALAGYLLCDVAPSGSTDGDLNVLMYVGVDERNHVFIMDLEVGHWQMFEFCERYLAMLTRWQAKANHVLEVWEKSPNYHSYLQHIGELARQRNVRTRVHAARRTQSAMSKDLRIATTAVRFQSRQVSVMSTVPRAWNTGTQLRCLWDPEGVTDPKTGAKLPGGDLVEHFVRFGQHSKTKKDIPDTFALVDTVDDHDGRRVCSWVPSLNRAADQETLRNQSDPRLRKLGSQTGFFNRYA